MDDNGDGLYDSSDGSIAKERCITRFFSSIRPRILESSVEINGTSGTLTAKVEDGTENIDIVYATVFPPGFEEPDPSAGEVTINLNAPTVRLEPDPNQEGVFSVEYPNGFEKSSDIADYRIVFYAQDVKGIQAPPQRRGLVDDVQREVFLPIVTR